MYLPPDTPWTDANDPAKVNRLVMQAKTTEYAKSLTKLEDDKPRMWGEIENFCQLNQKRKSQNSIVGIFFCVVIGILFSTLKNMLLP